MSDIGYLVGSGLLGAIGGAAQGRIDDTNAYNKRLDEAAAEERGYKRQVDFAELQNKLAEQRQIAIENRKKEEETRKGGLVKDAYSAAMVDGKVDPRQMRHNAIMSGNLQGAEVASGLISEEESGMLHQADRDYKTAYANRLNSEADLYKSGLTKSGKQIGGDAGGGTLAQQKWDHKLTKEEAEARNDAVLAAGKFMELPIDENGKPKMDADTALRLQALYTKNKITDPASMAKILNTWEPSEVVVNGYKYSGYKNPVKNNKGENDFVQITATKVGDGGKSPAKSEQKPSKLPPDEPVRSAKPFAQVNAPDSESKSDRWEKYQSELKKYEEAPKELQRLMRKPTPPAYQR